MLETECETTKKTYQEIKEAEEREEQLTYELINKKQGKMISGDKALNDNKLE